MDMMREVRSVVGVVVARDLVWEGRLHGHQVRQGVRTRNFFVTGVQSVEEFEEKFEESEIDHFRLTDYSTS